jgi:hypothetical protein
MQTTHAPTIEQLVTVVETLPPDRAHEVLGFARFIASQVDDPTFSDVLTVDEIAQMDVSDVEAAKAALQEPGKRVTLQQITAELGIAE